MTSPDDPYGTPPGGDQPPATPPPTYAVPPPAYGAPPPGYGQPAPPGWNPSPYGVAGFVPPAGYASWGERVAARLIDALVALPGIVFVILGAVVGGGAGVGLLILGYLVILGIAIWNEFVRQGRTGQTVGKQQMHIKLIREADGQVLGAGFCFVRSLAHIIDGIPCYLGYLWPLWDDKKQTFADKVCSTIEIKV
jgi:uncharacterized RDD family membrane protein YckC